MVWVAVSETTAHIILISLPKVKANLNLSLI